MDTESNTIRAIDFTKVPALELSRAQIDEHTSDGGKTEGGKLWIHIDRTSEESADWLANGSGLDSHTVGALLAQTTRPRVEYFDTGILLTLRGVNLNENADPADMISLRMWVDPNRLITVYRERLRAIDSAHEKVIGQTAPMSISELCVVILKGLTLRAGPIIDEINDRLDVMEEHLIDPNRVLDRTDLLDLRQDAIMLHRYIKPQRDVVFDLYETKHEMFDDQHAPVLKEIINLLTRFVEDLEAARGRTMLIQDELSNQYAERLNSRMYAVTMVATILLPMSILTGLLGVNVGGVPFAGSGYGFWIVCFVLVLMGLAGYLVVRMCKWL
ncbi:MAG: zinc transporter ZntB [Phycisphaerales bacterium]